MRFRVGSELAYRVTSETLFIFNIEAQQTARQKIEREVLTIDPPLQIGRWTMPENGNRYLRINAPAGAFRLRYEAEVELTPDLQDPAEVGEIPISRLPLSVFPNLYPNRCKLDHFARSTFGEFSAGHARVNAICDWIHEAMRCEGRVLDESIPAFDRFAHEADTCREFAHLGIALCRALGIPARYVGVYAFAHEPPGFHAAFEAFLCGRDGPGWYIFDPTRKADPASLVRVGLGRDGAEVMFCSAYGMVEEDASRVWVDAAGPNGHAVARAVKTVQADGLA